MEKKNVRFPMAGIFVVLYALLNILRSQPIIYSFWRNSTGKTGFLRRLLFSVISGSLQDRWWIASLVFAVCLGVVILVKRRDIFLAATILLQIIGPAKNLIASADRLFFDSRMSEHKDLIANSAGCFFIICSMLLLAFVVVANDENSKLKMDLSKVKRFSYSCWFLPGAIYSLGVLVKNGGNFKYTSFLALILPEVLFAVGVFLLGSWLKSFWEKPIANTTATYTANGTPCNASAEVWEGYCGLGKHILLSLFTCGIWPLIWIYRTTKFLNKAPYAEQHNPGSKLLLCMFVPFYQIYWYYKQGQRIDDFAKHKKLNSSDMATLCLILGIFIPIVANILMQDRINAICYAWAEEGKKPVQPAQPVVEQKNETDELRKYKALLDDGVITQEEFDAKKKQLLGL